MNASHKQLLISALSAEFTPIFTASNINSQTAIATYAPMEEEDGYTIFAGPSLRAAFKPIAGLNVNHADITFAIEFTGCTYNEKIAEYEWDGGFSCLTLGSHSDNIKLINSDSPNEGDWVDYERDSDFSELDDIEISKAVGNELMANMDADAKTQFIRAIFDNVKGITDSPAHSN